MSKMADYHARKRAEMGEEAYLEQMRQVRAKRRQLGGPFRLDYVDAQGRTGSEIATAAGRAGYESKMSKRNQEKE